MNEQHCYVAHKWKESVKIPQKQTYRDDIILILSFYPEYTNSLSRNIQEDRTANQIQPIIAFKNTFNMDNMDIDWSDLK